MTERETRHRAPPTPPHALLSPAASPTVAAVCESLRQVRRFHEVALSPDGTRAVWSEKAPDGRGAETLGSICVASLPAGKARRLTAGKDGQIRREHDAVFSPDGASIAFLSDAAARGRATVS